MSIRTPGMIKRQQKNRAALKQLSNQQKNIKISNQFLQIRDFADQQQLQQNKKNKYKFSHLNFQKNNLNSIPSEIFNNQYVSYLNFTSNQISELPKRHILMKLKFLQTLNLSYNKFKSFVLPKLQSLRVLILDFNQLHSLSFQNQPFLKILSCQGNQIDCLSIPSNLQILNASNNRLQNLYFMCEVGSKKNCLTQVNVSKNKLYDVKLIPQQHRNRNCNHNSQKLIQFPHLQRFELRENKIIHLDGFQAIQKVTFIDLSQNQISISRNILNQLLKLNNVQQINLLNNPLQEGGYNFSNAKNTLVNKLKNLKFINKQDVSQFIDLETERNSVKQSPYKLFIQDHGRIQTQIEVITKEQAKRCSKKQWNFTLGDCEQNDPSINLDLLSSRNINQISPVLKVTVPQIKLNYNEYLRKLLPMSFISPKPIKYSQINKPVSMRIQPQSQQYKIINEMLKCRGGAVYIRKIIIWGNNNFGHFDQAQQFGFYNQQLRQKQFGQISKGSNKKQFIKNLIGSQPNMFCCYHLLIRIGRNHNQYGCIYAIQTSHL